MSQRFFIGIGSNLGDRLANLRSAAAALGALPHASLARRSRIWETRPVGPGSGPFLNAALELRLGEDIDAGELLEHLLGIERQHGRYRRERWGDRTLDLDLLGAFVLSAGRETELYIDRPGLTLPHSELGTRDFVLQPLLDIDPELALGGHRCAELFAALMDEQRTLLRQLPDALVSRPGFC